MKTLVEKVVSERGLTSDQVPEFIHREGFFSTSKVAREHVHTFSQRLIKTHVKTTQRRIVSRLKSEQKRIACTSLVKPLKNKVFFKSPVLKFKKGLKKTKKTSSHA